MVEYDVIEARVVDGHKVNLRFADGTEGTLDFSEFLSFKGVFEPLRDQDEFAKISVDPETGTVVWPNGADLAPEVLHSRVTGEPIVVRGETVFVPPARTRA